MCDAEELQYRCEGECVDLSSDDRHCGGCLQPCGERDSCTAGECSDRCTDAQAWCRGQCVELSSNSHHCGECGHACSVFEECLEGECVPLCPDHFDRCGDTCVDVHTNSGNCGECDNACDPWLVCRVGSCECADLLLGDCDGACRDLSADVDNCGECGHQCDPDKTCIDSECVCPDEGWGICDGRCVDLRNDEQHCGECNEHCDPDVECRYGRCGGPELFPGVQTNLPVAELRGWEECFSEPYGSSGTNVREVLARCDRPFLLLGCRRVNADVLVVAAAGEREHVLHESGQGNELHVHNDVGWYFSDSHSWGFVAAGEAVRRSSCDVDSTRPETRLCWHTRAAALSGGYRCGATTSLNNDNSWERVIFQ